MNGRTVTLAMALFAVSATGAGATTQTFTDTVDFDDDDCRDRGGRDGLQLVTPTHGVFTYTYSHRLAFSPAADSLSGVTLALTHRDNSATPGETWLLSGGSSTDLGPLVFSEGGWVTQVFSIPPSLYPSFSASGWTLRLHLTETTRGTDKLWIERSVLSGTYDDGVAAPVPEPSSLALVGLGLGLGARALRRRVRG